MEKGGFKEYLLANICHDLDTLHANKWLSGDTLEKILVLLESEKNPGQQGSVKQNGIQARRSTIGHTLPNVPQKPAPPKARAASSATALYDNTAEEADDLEFSAGDIITDFKRVNDDWGCGRCHGREGIFPLSYVEICSHSPCPARPSSSPARTEPSSAKLQVTEHRVVHEVHHEKRKNKWAERGRDNVFGGATAGFGWAAGGIAAHRLLT